MKKNELLQSVKVIILGLVLSLGISFVFSATIAPINAGTSPQVKNGGLSVNSFLAVNNSILNGIVTIHNFADATATENRPICANNSGNIIVCGI